MKGMCENSSDGRAFEDIYMSDVTEVFSGLFRYSQIERSLVRYFNSITKARVFAHFFFFLFFFFSKICMHFAI